MSEEVKVINQYERDDGTKVFEYENGIEVYVTSEEVKVKRTDGITAVFKSDGTEIYQFQNGDRIQKNFDGTVHFDAPEGDEYHQDANGREHYKFSNGNEQWIGPDDKITYFISDEKEYVTCTGPQWTHSWKIAAELAKRKMKKRLGF